MAQMLYRRHSVRRHISASRRHIRLCHQYSCDEYAQRIKDTYDGLIERHRALGIREEQLENAQDDVVCKDRELENTIRSTFEKCRQHDRVPDGAPVLPVVFPEGSFGGMIRAGSSKDAQNARQLLRRLQSLGEEHPLYPLTTELLANTEALEAALAAVDQRAGDVRPAQTEEQLARKALRDRYRSNYYDAHVERGKFIAEQLFPRLSRPASVKQEDDEAADQAPDGPAPQPQEAASEQ